MDSSIARWKLYFHTGMSYASKAQFLGIDQRKLIDAGMVVPVISGWIALPARILLNFILLVADWFSKFPHAQELVKMTVFSMLTCYIILVVIIIGLNKRNQSVKMVLNED